MNNKKIITKTYIHKNSHYDSYYKCINKNSNTNNYEKILNKDLTEPP